MPHFKRVMVPVLIFFGGLLIYTLTLARGVLTADNGEFQWIGATLGLAHPPGFGLYTLLAFAISRLPLAEPAVLINWLSAFFGALTLVIVYLIVVDLAPKNPGWSATAGGAIAAVSLATSTTFWVQATTANIRSLTALLAALAFWALIQLAQAGSDSKAARQLKALTAFALAVGFGLTHHLSLAFMALVMGSYALWRGGHLLKQAAAWRFLALSTAAAAAPWLYLPLREPALRSWTPFWRYALGLGFSGDFFYFRTWPELGDRLLVMGNVLTFQFLAILLIGAAAGWILMLRRRPAEGLLFGGSLAVHTLVTATYRAPQSVEYMLPAYVPLVVALGYGIAVLMDGLLIGGTDRWRRAARWAVPILFGLAGLAQGIDRYPSLAWLAHSENTADYVNQMISQAPQQTVVLADWHWYTPLKYSQEVEGQRPDMTIEFVFPRSADYGRDWAAAIDTWLQTGRPVAATHLDEAAYAGLPPALPLGEARLFDPLPPRLDLPAPADPPAFELAAVSGWQTEVSDEGEVTVTVEWLASGVPPAEWRLFAQLRQADGRPAAVDDQPADFSGDPLFRSRFDLIPAAGTPPGPYEVVLGAYPAAESSGSVEATLGSVALPGSRWPPVTRSPVRWSQPAAGRTLVGYDWDHTFAGQGRLYLHWQLANGRYWSEAIDLPAGIPYQLEGISRGFSPPGPVELAPTPGTHYVPFGQGIVWLGSRPALEDQVLAPGQIILTRQHFSTARPVERDIGFAVRLIGLADDHYTWLWLNPDADADIPAMGAIPTLKWIAGSEIGHPRRLTIPPQATSGQPVEGFLRPYDVFTNRPLPILDDRFLAAGKFWVPFDSGTIE